jgi:Putative adhesin
MNSAVRNRFAAGPACCPARIPRCGVPGLLVLIVSLLVVARSAAAVEILEEIVEQKYAVDSDATLSIGNTDGSCRIYGGNGTEISIEAIKKAYSSNRLKDIVVDVKATPKSVAIETIFPPNKNRLSLEDRSGTVDYIITIPATMRITRLDLVNGEVLLEGLRRGSAIAHVVNGWLIARNCFGDLDLTLANGRLEAAYDWWEETKFSVKLASPDGDIRAIIPSDASVSIFAQTATGGIANALAREEDEQSERAHVLHFTTGSEPKIAFEMNSTSGDIRIDKAY